MEKLSASVKASCTKPDHFLANLPISTPSVAVTICQRQSHVSRHPGQLPDLHIYTPRNTITYRKFHVGTARDRTTWPLYPKDGLAACVEDTKFRHPECPFLFDETNGVSRWRLNFQFLQCQVHHVKRFFVLKSTVLLFITCVWSNIPADSRSTNKCCNDMVE